MSKYAFHFSLNALESFRYHLSSMHIEHYLVINSAWLTGEMKEAIKCFFDTFKGGNDVCDSSISCHMV